MQRSLNEIHSAVDAKISQLQQTMAADMNEVETQPSLVDRAKTVPPEKLQ